MKTMRDEKFLDNQDNFRLKCNHVRTWNSSLPLIMLGRYITSNFLNTKLLAKLFRSYMRAYKKRARMWNRNTGAYGARRHYISTHEVLNAITFHSVARFRVTN